MKKSFLNVFAVAAIFSLALVSCDKTAKAVEDVKENTEEVAEDVNAQLDTLQAEVDTLQQTVDSAVAE